jgi:hypothetical protein
MKKILTTLLLLYTNAVFSHITVYDLAKNYASEFTTVMLEARCYSKAYVQIDDSNPLNWVKIPIQQSFVNKLILADSPVFIRNVEKQSFEAAIQKDLCNNLTAVTFYIIEKSKLPSVIIEKISYYQPFQVD